MTHLLLILLAVVRKHVDHEHAPTRSHHATHFRERARRLWRVVQNERQHRDVELAGLDRQALQFSLPDVDVGRAAQSLPSGVEHVVGTVNRYHAPDVRRHNFRQLSRATAEVTDDQRRIDETEHGPQEELVAEQLAAKPIPSARRRREELLRLRPTPAQHAPQPTLVLLGTSRGGHLLGDERPQPASAGIEVVDRHAVEAARAVAPRRHPPIVGQRLQMPADGRLRHLEHRAELGHRQFVLFEQQQHAAARRIRQRRHVVQNGCDHLSVIRM